MRALELVPDRDSGDSAPEVGLAAVQVSRKAGLQAAEALALPVALISGQHIAIFVFLESELLNVPLEGAANRDHH